MPVTQAERCARCGKQELHKIHNMFMTMSEHGGGKGHLFVPKGQEQRMQRENEQYARKMGIKVGKWKL